VRRRPAPLGASARDCSLRGEGATSAPARRPQRVPWRSSRGRLLSTGKARALTARIGTRRSVVKRSNLARLHEHRRPVIEERRLTLMTAPNLMGRRFMSNLSDGTRPPQSRCARWAGFGCPVWFVRNGSDAARARGFRCDRPSRALRRPTTNPSKQAHFRERFARAPPRSAWLSQSSKSTFGPRVGTKCCRA
jgi:hypothetical protein